LFKESIVLRNEIAHILGYEDFSSYALEDKMAKNTHVVSQFLDNIRTRLTPKAQKELEYLKNLKAEECKARNIPNDGEYYFWDHRYYRRLLTEAEYEVDELKVSEYFSLESTVAGMLKIFETVMGFVFIKLDTSELKKLSPTGKAEDVLWHPDVIVYSVWNESQGDGFVGYLYMDLHPRTGKYSHECNTNFQPGFTYKDGTRHYPSTALICNFTPPTPQKPSLLKHHEVVTLFHELGHGIHSLAAKTRYSRFHGTAVAWDFVETPSKMLEHWCWTPSVLKSLSQHWSTKEQIPNELVEKLVATRNVTLAIQNLIQVHYSIFDQVCHTAKSQREVKAIETSSLFNELRVSVTMIKGLENEANRR
jgi:metallopeptidase MepB